MERVLEGDNRRRALRQVRGNKGAPGIDGMTVDGLVPHIKAHGPEIRASLLDGTYVPQPVRRVEIPKASGGVRSLGIPVVLDRFIEQALMQVLQADWDPSFSASSFGFRPKRSAHQAVLQAQSYIQAGYTWGVDVDLEKFFDRVNQDVLLSRVRARVLDRRVVALIHRFLRAGVGTLDGVVEATLEGTPQGSPLSPLLTNLLLDEFDKELERRGHRFARYADDANIYVRSRAAGERVLASITRFLERRLRELRSYLLGWRGYYGFSEVPTPLRDLDKWIRRRLRSYHWKQWGRRGYRELRNRGVSARLAWNTAKSAHGPWRLSRSPALAIALPARYFADLGLPNLVEA